MDGMMIDRFQGKMKIFDTHVINNSANGLRIVYSSFLSCTIHQMFSKKNTLNGLYFLRVALKSNFSDSVFSGNAHSGLAIAYGAGKVKCWNVTFGLNKHCGVRFSDGKVSANFKYCDFSRNSHDGGYISNEEGTHQFLNCTASLNSRYGISLCDPPRDISRQRHYFKHLTLTDCVISENANYGVKLALEKHTSNVSITINKNRVASNSGGGIILSPDHNRWYFDRPRRVTALLENNHFEQNKVNAIYVYCTGFLGIDALIDSNVFVNNTKKVIKLFDDISCGSYRSNPVNVKISRNRFNNNRVENAVFIDFYWYPEARLAVLTNNTFEDNEPHLKNLFPIFFLNGSQVGRSLSLKKEVLLCVKTSLKIPPSLIKSLRCFMIIVELLTQSATGGARQMSAKSLTRSSIFITEFSCRRWLSSRISSLQKNVSFVRIPPDQAVFYEVQRLAESWIDRLPCQLLKRPTMFEMTSLS